MTADPPLAILAELTHRCPLQCPYCSNPLELERAAAELTTAEWCRHAAGRGLYTNLITSAVLLNERSLGDLLEAGIDHVQVSFQDAEASGGDLVGGYRGGHERKLGAARLVFASGLPLTLNFVVHRLNLARLPAMIELALALGARRIEVAHVQYYGWGLANRDALLPSRAQLDEATETVEAARVRLKGTLVIDYVVPDYYASRPKACMGGWARRFINISPAGRALPCHAAESLPGFSFPSVRDTSLADIWYGAPAFERFRGTAWMPAPCAGCALREVDWGGCRCQAFALTGDAARTDPACALSPDRAVMDRAIEASRAGSKPLVYRRIGAEAWAD
jgi:pyrroloquinoline quinone biosynthesis protein E